MNNKTYVINIKNIYKRFKSRLVLDNINCELNNHEIVGLLGPNGSGKTTLFYIIAGLVNADSGNIFYDHYKITNYPIHKRAKELGIGYLPQDVSIFRNLNVEDNLLSVLELYVKNKKERQNRLEELLEQFHIQHIRKSPAMSLSGGERRRVEIARTLSANPTFVLFDEPFAGVDPIAVNEIKQIIKILKRDNIGVLITDHNVIETLNIVDRAYILYNSKIIYHGNKEQITSNSTVQQLYIGDLYSNLQ